MRIAMVLCAFFLMACGQQCATTPNATIKGYDTSAGRKTTITVWQELGRAGSPVVATVKEGDRVTVLERNADGAKIETIDCKQGWIGAEFIVDLPQP